jgi:hypothetical protein
MVAPPGIPQDRLEALQKAFMALGGDPEFMADAQKSNIQIELADHRSVRKVIDLVAGTPEPLTKRLMQVTSP